MEAFTVFMNIEIQPASELNPVVKKAAIGIDKKVDDEKVKK
jgi:hypothetical protein